jgi:hypothetical protein
VKDNRISRERTQRTQRRRIGGNRLRPVSWVIDFLQKCSAPSGLGLSGEMNTQGVALVCPIAGFQPSLRHGFPWGSVAANNQLSKFINISNAVAA